MNTLLRRLCLWSIITLLAGVLALAQDWQKSDALPGIKLDGLTGAQKTLVLKILREQGCSCGCSMKMAQCRVEDPSCSYSLGLATSVIQSVKDGKTEQQAIEIAKASRWGHVQEETAKLLEDPVKIPVDGSPVTGPANAKVTIIEFSDFQCPYCVLAVPEIASVLKAYPNQVRLIFKQYPLEIHSQAFLAATSALAANNQSKFWPMHDALFAHHNELTRDTMLKIAKDLGLDVARFQKDMDSKEVQQAVKKDMADGDKAGVEGTPTIFINGQRYNGPISLSYLKPLVDAAAGIAPAKVATR
jgi:protein-disulfide isomerase